MIASYSRCAFVLASTLFAVSMFYAGAASAAHFLSIIDLSANFAGVTMSLINVVSSTTGIMVPLFVQYYVTLVCILISPPKN